MIVFITTRGNGYTLKSLADGTFGVPVPQFKTTHYERLLRAWRLPRATYIFGDLERLTPWELRLAAELYRSMRVAGLRCLNDPAKAMSRVQLLTALNEAGVNPFSVLRADAVPKPARFPVFIRSEDNHAKADATLFHNQQDLDRALQALTERGIPLRGMLVVEQAAEKYSDTLWAKWGTWRIGDKMIVEHIAVDDSWLVKIGDHEKIVDAVAADEHDAVTSNRFATDIRRAFDIANIEFGRADSGTKGSRNVVYEINTNPYLGWFSPDRRALRRETQIFARSRIADALAAIDTKESGNVRLLGTTIRRRIRWWRPGFITPRRP
jgi:hypothetical protein